ncbi:hypothetical protein OUZ56_023136 [Daphnia magna]|uniref:Uncharacterized protein n=1 Tax=Daphnia magna TaxID=35525 RepID=A0ABR0AYE3_9CRUS|nr:hypothetical protein OUZ56_023136 [Daphnia magna]
MAETNDSLHREKEIAQCYLYNIMLANFKQCDLNQSIHDTFLKKCSRWVYDTCVFRSTIVSHFDLTCENEWKQTVASSMFMLGMLIGAVRIGYIGYRTKENINISPTFFKFGIGRNIICYN